MVPQAISGAYISRVSARLDVFGSTCVWGVLLPHKLILPLCLCSRISPSTDCYHRTLSAHTWSPLPSTVTHNNWRSEFKLATEDVRRFQLAGSATPATAGAANADAGDDGRNAAPAADSIFSQMTAFQPSRYTQYCGRMSPQCRRHYRSRRPSIETPSPTSQRTSGNHANGDACSKLCTLARHLQGRRKKQCQLCADVSKAPIKAPLASWLTTDKPWTRIHVNYAGPFEGHCFFVIVGSYSKWPEIFMTDRTTSFATLKLLRQLFAQFEIPEMIVSDNSIQFISAEFATSVQETASSTSSHHPVTPNPTDKTCR